jgi:hypothetical protein
MRFFIFICFISTCIADERLLSTFLSIEQNSDLETNRSCYDHGPWSTVAGCDTKLFSTNTFYLKTSESSKKINISVYYNNNSSKKLKVIYKINDKAETLYYDHNPKKELGLLKTSFFFKEIKFLSIYSSTSNGQTTYYGLSFFANKRDKNGELINYGYLSKYFEVKIVNGCYKAVRTNKTFSKVIISTSKTTVSGREAPYISKIAFK